MSTRRKVRFWGYNQVSIGSDNSMAPYMQQTVQYSLAITRFNLARYHIRRSNHKKYRLWLELTRNTSSTCISPRRASYEMSTPSALDEWPCLNRLDTSNLSWTRTRLHLNIRNVSQVPTIYKDTPVVRPTYHYYGNPYTGKTASLYWNGPQADHWSLDTTFMVIFIW